MAERLITPAVVLGAVDFGEADRVVTLLSQKLGKVSAVARGARKSKKRFGAGLGLFGVGEATLRDRPGADLALLEEFHGGRGFPQILTDMARVAHASYACELVRELAPARQPEPLLFELLMAMLGILDAGPARAETLRVFELALLDAVGLRPELARCMHCGEVPSDLPGQVFDFGRGGVVCAGCHGHGRAIDGGLRAFLIRAQATPLDGASEIGGSAADAHAARVLLGSLFEAHIGRTLKSVEFIAKLNAAT